MRSVVIDVERLRVLNCGLGRFSLHLGDAIQAAAGDEFRTIFLVPRNVPAEFQTSAATIRANPWRKESVVRWVRPWMQHLQCEPACDLWHVMHQNSKYWPMSSGTPVLLTIHDLNFLHERSPREIPKCLRRTQQRVDRASAVATVSQYSARQIQEHLNLRGKPLRVIYNGLSAPRVTSSSRPDYLPKGRFLFTIGDITAKKNFHVLLDMMQRLPDLWLVIAGRKRDRYAKWIESETVRRQLQSRVFLPGEVSDAQRQWLYENCEAFVFPSIAEGFGLPVIEAMSFGKPVFLATTTSLPEIGGTWAFYWNTFDPMSMAQVLRQGLVHVARNPQFGDQCRLHANQFSWQRAAEAYLDFYRELIDQHLPTMRLRAA